MPNTAPKEKLPDLKNPNPTALIAGGAGFIGSHLVQTLVSQNFKVICVDNFSTGKRENLKEVLTSENFTLLEADISDPNFTLPEGFSIDYCFHLASIEDYISKGLSLDTLLVNSLGTKQLLEISREHQAKFILISAADLYSGAISSSSLRYYFGKTPAEEAILSTHEAKRFSEALAFEYYKKYKLPLTIIRLKDAYGPRMNLQRGDELSNLLARALKKETLQVPGDGLKVINPTFISDIIFGLIKAALGDFSGEIFILVNAEKVTLESFAQTIKLVAGPLEIEHTKDVEGFDFGAQHFDLENTKEKLVWKPRVALAEGFSSVIHQVKMEESKKITDRSSEVEPRLSETNFTPAHSKEISNVVRKGKFSKWFRGLIFFLAASIVIVTLIYPAANLVVNSYSGRVNLEESYQLLLSEKTENSIATAFVAQKSFQEAQDALKNLNWALKIIGLSEESAETSDVLATAAVLSQAIRSASRGNQILLTAAEQNLIPEQAEGRLNESLDNLYAAADSLQESKVNLEKLSWQAVPKALLPSQIFLEGTISSLTKQVEELIYIIEQNLAKPNQND